MKETSYINVKSSNIKFTSQGFNVCFFKQYETSKLYLLYATNDKSLL